MVVIELLFALLALQAKIKGVLVDCKVAMVTYYAMKITTPFFHLSLCPSVVSGISG